MKKLIIFTILFTSFFLIRSNLYSENLNLIPKKKPSLSNEEREQKITLNIIKPLKKPVMPKTAIKVIVAQSINANSSLIP